MLMVLNNTSSLLKKIYRPVISITCALIVFVLGYSFVQSLPTFNVYATCDTITIYLAPGESIPSQYFTDIKACYAAAGIKNVLNTCTTTCTFANGCICPTGCTLKIADEGGTCGGSGATTGGCTQEGQCINGLLCKYADQTTHQLGLSSQKCINSGTSCPTGYELVQNSGLASCVTHKVNGVCPTGSTSVGENACSIVIAAAANTCTSGGKTYSVGQKFCFTSTTYATCNTGGTYSTAVCGGDQICVNGGCQNTNCTGTGKQCIVGQEYTCTNGQLVNTNISCSTPQNWTCPTGSSPSGTTNGWCSCSANGGTYTFYNTNGLPSACKATSGGGSGSGSGTPTTQPAPAGASAPAVTSSPSGSDVCGDQAPVNTQFRVADPTDKAAWIDGASLTNAHIKVGQKVDVNCFAKNGATTLLGGYIEVTAPEATAAVQASSLATLRNYELKKEGVYTFNCKSSQKTTCTNADYFSVAAADSTNTGTTDNNTNTTDTTNTNTNTTDGGSNTTTVDANGRTTSVSGKTPVSGSVDTTIGLIVAGVFFLLGGKLIYDRQQQNLENAE